MTKKNQSKDRSTIVNVFESYFEDDIEYLCADSVLSLPKAYSEELVYLIDEHLSAMNAAGFPDNAVMLDSLANPIVIVDDPTLAKTTRQTKQAALLHHEVVIPMQPLKIDFFADDDFQKSIRYPAALIEWAKTNAKLLRSNIITLAARPSPFDVLGFDRTIELAGNLTEALHEPEYEELQKFLRDPRNNSDHLDKDVTEAWVYGAIMDLVNAGSINGNLTFFDNASCLVHAEIVKLGMQAQMETKKGNTGTEILHFGYACNR